MTPTQSDSMTHTLLSIQACQHSHTVSSSPTQRSHQLLRTGNAVLNKLACHPLRCSRLRHSYLILQCHLFAGKHVSVRDCWVCVHGCTCESNTAHTTAQMCLPYMGLACRFLSHSACPSQFISVEGTVTVCLGDVAIQFALSHPGKSCPLQTNRGTSTDRQDRQIVCNVSSRREIQHPPGTFLRSTHTMHVTCVRAQLTATSPLACLASCCAARLCLNRCREGRREEGGSFCELQKVCDGGEAEEAGSERREGGERNTQSERARERESARARERASERAERKS